MHFFKRWVGTIGILGLGLFLGTAGAEIEPWLQGPCGPAARRFCSDVIAKGGNVLECLRSHEKELGPACELKREERRAEMMTAMIGFRKECGPDLEKFCRKAKPPTPPKGSRGPHGCLRERYSELSSGCKTQLDSYTALRESIREKAKEYAKKRQESKPAKAAKAPKAAAPAATPVAPTPGPSHTTSLERESADLAAAIAMSRGLRLGEPLSPSERTMKLAYAATTLHPRGERDSEKVETSSEDSSATLDE